MGSTDWSVAPAALIDTHAHLHDRFDTASFLSAAASNLEGAARALPSAGGGRAARVLAVMRPPGRPLEPRLDRSDAAGWRIAQSDPSAWRAEHERLGRLILIEGRQYVSREGLELLAAPLTNELEADAPLAALIEQAVELGLLPIVPWGFGKWLGRRGAVISDLLDRQPPGRFLLGDNGGRPRVSRDPRLLRRAAELGFPIVCGSDPLPLAGEEDRAGSSGSAFEGDFDPRDASNSYRRAIGGDLGPPIRFGRGSGLGRFLWSQTRLRLPGARA